MNEETELDHSKNIGGRPVNAIAGAEIRGELKAIYQLRGLAAHDEADERREKLAWESTVQGPQVTAKAKVRLPFRLRPTLTVALPAGPGRPAIRDRYHSW